MSFSVSIVGASTSIAAKERLNSMSKNIDTLDRALRIVMGIVLIALVFVGPQTPWGWVGLVPLITALLGWCPAYRLLVLRNCPASRKV
jgi:hypothetical protein